LPQDDRLVKAFVPVSSVPRPEAAKELRPMPETSDVLRLPGDPPIAVQVRRSARAKRVSLRVSRLDGAVTLTLPARAPLRHAQTFLAERETWLRSALNGIEGPASVEPGTTLPVEGVALTVTAAALRAARIDGTALLVAQSRPAASAQAFLKALARDRLAARVTQHATNLGRSPGKLTLRDTRSRWGSCAPSGDLMFSWRLIMAPPAILDYVAAHEVAHLRHMNHSAAFWATCAELYPDHAAARRWLKQNGPGLHQYRFSPA
jgi:predicted metal-dependent hydrolase